MFWRLGRTLACPSLKPGHCSSEFSSSCVTQDQENLSLKLKLARSARLGNGGKARCVWGKLRPYVASGRPRGRLGGGRRRLLPVTSITANPALLNPTTHHHTKVSQVSRNTCVTSIESITANPALLNTTTHHHTCIKSITSTKKYKCYKY